MSKCDNYTSNTHFLFFANRKTQGLLKVQISQPIHSVGFTKVVTGLLLPKEVKGMLKMYFSRLYGSFFKVIWKYLSRIFDVAWDRVKELF